MVFWCSPGYRGFDNLMRFCVFTGHWPRLGKPDFIEIKSVTFCGESKAECVRCVDLEVNKKRSFGCFWFGSENLEVKMRRFFQFICFDRSGWCIESWKLLGMWLRCRLCCDIPFVYYCFFKGTFRVGISLPGFQFDYRLYTLAWGGKWSVIWMVRWSKPLHAIWWYDMIQYYIMLQLHTYW